MADLLPCPFCGGEAKLHYTKVRCASCHVEQWTLYTEATIAAWNRRPQATQPQAELRQHDPNAALAASSQEKPRPEPVAWQYREANDDGTWGAWVGCDKQLAASIWRQVRPLYAGAETVARQPQVPDMFWDADDRERFGYDIDELVADYDVGSLVKIEQAMRLPTITVRVIQDPENPDYLTYEEVDGITATPAPRGDSLNPDAQGESE